MSRAVMVVASGVAARAVSRPAWQFFVRLGVLPHCSLRAVLFVILAVCGRAVDAATVIYEYNNTGTAAYEFATIPGPINGDLGESAAFFANVDGAKHGLSDDLTDSSSLTNGDGSSDGSHTTSPLFFFANDEDPARLLMSWDSPQPIQEVRTFSWHSHTGTARAAQRYTLYGTNAAIDGDNWTYNSSDWTLLATVDSAADQGSWSGHPFQTAVSIQGTGPGVLGTYQHLLWDTTASNAPHATEQHTIWREFDVLVNSGGLISNGNFETASGDPLKFTGWTYHGTDPDTAAIVQTDSVIAGNRSAEIVRSGGHFLQQQSTEPLSTFVFGMDFAVSTQSGRSMNVFLMQTTTNHNQAMQFRVQSGQLQVYNAAETQWSAIGSLTTHTTGDPNDPFVEWNGEDPVVNHLKIVGYFSDPNNRYYDVTLNGDTVSNIQWFSGDAPTSISYIRLAGGVSSSNWLVDNVYLVPEPSSAAMLGVVLLLAVAPWRRRRDGGTK